MTTDELINALERMESEITSTKIYKEGGNRV